MTGNLILGLDIGGTKTAVVLGTDAGAIVERRPFPTEPLRGFARVYEDLCTHVRDVLRTASAPIEAMSVSIGGPLDVLRGIVQSPPNLPEWNDIPLKEMLAAEFHLPVFVEHDGNAGALAEWKFGAGRGCTNLVFLTMGTGFGAGLILNGKLYRGTQDTAGEIGHIRIAEDGPLCYGKRGSLEGFASGTGIARLASMLAPDRWPDPVAVADLYRLYRESDPDARRVFAEASRHLGRGLALLIDLLNPERIILGGLGVRVFDALVEPALLVAGEEALPRARAACSIVPAGLGEAIGDYAALCAALDQGCMGA